MIALLKPLKYFGCFLVLSLIIIQFFKPTKNLMASNLAMQKDISTLYKVPEQVNNLMQKACYKCHSNNTVYPWYSNIQPVAWYVNNHVLDGKRHFNFNNFASYNLRKQYHKLEEIKEQIAYNEMPLKAYTIIHGDAKLSDEDKLLITNWVDTVKAQMETQYPTDSFIQKKISSCNFTVLM